LGDISPGSVAHAISAIRITVRKRDLPPAKSILAKPKMSPAREIRVKFNSLQLTNPTCHFYTSLHLNSLNLKRKLKCTYRFMKFSVQITAASM